VGARRPNGPLAARRAPPDADMLVLKRTWLEDHRDAFGNGFDAIMRPLTQPPATHPRDLDDTRRCSEPRGFRYFLADHEGEGYWDHFKLSDHLIVSITEATYRRDQPINIEGSDYFKLRIVLSGELRDLAGRQLACGPQAMLFISAGYNGASYQIVADKPLTMVVLNTRRSMLTETLGIDPATLPPPFDAIFRPANSISSNRIGLHPNVFYLAQRMLDARLRISSPLRCRYLEALSEAMILEIIQELRDRDVGRTAVPSWSRDSHLVLEVRDYLAKNYAKPLRIPQLARMVGINQTKLKAGFRELVGTSIYKYIQQCRMERASELLLAGNTSIAEIGYLVGYEHPANFTSAFRRHFGYLPRSWRQRPNAWVQGAPQGPSQ
jgi:AraC-like DNA-binding protein